MESLYRKYRPLTFESVVGQRHIVSTLEHAVAEARLSHAYLFCGPRGTGKTTMARILAKSLLCQNAEAARAAGGSGCMPDGTCPECEAIAAGTHPDVYELDAASRTGVDNVREEIINSVNFAPVRGAYKVYIVDEVHMLTTAAFNALLKTLEEPPAHVVFVLCTTDPQKLPETILSRCQRFDFHRISNEDMVGRMRHICEREGFGFDAAALEIVAKHARGGMRDALSTLEQLSVFGGGAVRLSDARVLLGEVASTVLSDFARKIAERDTVALFGLVRAQVDEGNDLMELTRDLVAHMRDVYTASIAGTRAELFDGTPDEVALLVEEAALFEGSDRLARTLTVLDDAVLEMRNASDPRLVLEIALTRLARPETDLTLEALAERVARLEGQLAFDGERAPKPEVRRAGGGSPAGSAPVPATAAAPQAPAAVTEAEPAAQASARSRAAAPAASVPAASEPARAVGPAAASVPGAPAPAPASQAPAAGASSQAPVAVSAPAAAPETRVSPVPVRSAPAPVAPEPSAVSTPQVSATVSAEDQPDMATCAITPPASDAGDLQRRWLDTVKHIMAAQPSRGALLQSSRAVGDDGQTLTISFPAGSSFALKMISRPDSHALVMPIICQVFGKRNVTYVMDGDAPASSGRSASAPAPVAPSAASAPAPPAPEPQPTASASAATVSAPESAPPAPPVPASELRPAPVAAAPAFHPVSAAPMPAAPAPEPEMSPAPAVDQASGPTVLPEPDLDADRRAWEDEQIPYDDATIAAYADDDEVPPFEAPTAPASTIQREQSQANPSSSAAFEPKSADSASAPALAAEQAEGVPQTAEDAQALLQSVWGNVTFKPME